MSYRNILIIRNDRMGDLLMSLPAVHEIRRSYPKAEVLLLLREELIPLLRDHPDIDRLIPFPHHSGSGWIQILRWAPKLRCLKADAAVILNPTRLFHVAAFLAAIPIRVGYRRKCGFLLTRSMSDSKASRRLHETQFNLELVRLLGTRPVPCELRLPANSHRLIEADRLLQQHGLFRPGLPPPIAVHPWTSDPAKNWPLDAFFELLRSLAGSQGPFLILGGTEEVVQMDSWKSRIGPLAADLVGQVPLALLPALLRRCSLLISNDSGPVHVAAAVGTPTLVVAPRQHGEKLERWRPLGEGHRVLIAPSPEQVAEATLEMLRHHEDSPR